MSSANRERDHYSDDEITLKELILKIQYFWEVLWENKLKIILAILILGGANFAFTNENPRYTSAVIFLVSEDEMDGRSASGINLRNTRQALLRTNNKISELSRSSKIIHKVLLSKVTIDNQHDYLANHIIKIFNLHDKWAKPSDSNVDHALSLNQFLFSTNNLTRFSKKELRAIRQIHQIIAGNNLTKQKGLMDITYNVNTDLFSLVINTKHSELSTSLMNSIFLELQEFYIQETVGRPKKAYESLKLESDSLNTLLNQKIRQIAYFKDRNKNVYGSSNNITLQNLERQTIRLEQESNKTYQLLRDTEYILNKGTPEFIEIDRTYLPIIKVKSRLKALLLGGVLGGFLIGSFLIMKRIVTDALAS